MSRSLRMLTEMGLRVWVRRGRSAGGTAGSASGEAAPRSWEIIANRPAARVAVVVAGSSPLRFPRGDPAGELLARILASLKAPLEAFAVLRVDHAAGYAAAIEALPGRPPRHIFLFGAGEVPEDPRLVQLPDLQAMLDDPALKRPAWAALKPWVGRLG